MNTIDGKLETTKEKHHSINPATGEPGPDVPVASSSDVDRAMDSAKATAETWREVPWNERRQAILAFADALDTEKEEFIRMLTREQGKPVGIPLYLYHCS